MLRQNNLSSSRAAKRAKKRILAAVDGTGNTLKAWNALWDLIQSREEQTLQELRAALAPYAQDNPSTRSAQIANEFIYTIDRPIILTSTPGQILPSKEVRDEHKRMQAEARQEALRRMGVQPGQGLPMWAMYMTRRNKRSWDT